MRRDQYWKNFNLGTELDIAGRFLYNGIQVFHQMEHFCREEDAFEFLYNVSVGLERLLKIALILTKHDQNTDQEKFEKELSTHSHQNLVERLKHNHTLDFAPVHNEFISILTRFYKSYRYGRYSLDSVAVVACERNDLNSFIGKHLNFDIEIESDFENTKNERQHRIFIGKVISKIVLPVFKIIKYEARNLNIYTYETEFGSKAYKIFQAEKFDFEDEDILHIELLAYFMSENAEGSNARFLKEVVDPLPFDPGLEADYLAALRSDQKKLQVIDELEMLYEGEVNNFKNRREMLEAASSEYLDYGPNLYDDEKSS